MENCSSWTAWELRQKWLLTVQMKEMLFADVTALTTHAKQDLQELINQFNLCLKEIRTDY